MKAVSIDVNLTGSGPTWEVSLIIPVKEHAEWITLGNALHKNEETTLAGTFMSLIPECGWTDMSPAADTPTPHHDRLCPRTMSPSKPSCPEGVSSSLCQVLYHTNRKRNSTSWHCLLLIKMTMYSSTMWALYKICLALKKMHTALAGRSIWRW